MIDQPRVGSPGRSAAVMSRVLQHHADVPRRHTRHVVVHRTAGRTARWGAGALLGVGAGLLGAGAPLLLALAGGLFAAALLGMHWLATLPPRPDPDPDAVRWSAGAAGERRTARLLRPLERRGWTVLHDLRIPGSRANIDHLVIGPNGVQVVDSKAWRAPLRSWLGVLWCGTHPVDVASTAWEAMRVEETLGPALIAGGCVRVEAVICVHGPAIPRPGYTVRVARTSLGRAAEGDVVVHIVGARDLRRHLQRCRAGVVAPGDVQLLGGLATRELPAAA